MKWFLAILLVFSVQSQAELAMQPGSLARGEAYCNGNDCLRYGWVSLAPAWRSETLCILGNCLYQGWSSRSSNGSWTEVRCMQGGCFNDGWFERINGYDFRIDCRRGDCMTYGWNINGMNNYFVGGSGDSIYPTNGIFPEQKI